MNAKSIYYFFWNKYNIIFIQMGWACVWVVYASVKTELFLNEIWRTGVGQSDLLQKESA